MFLFCGAVPVWTVGRVLRATVQATTAGAVRRGRWNLSGLWL